MSSEIETSEAVSIPVPIAPLPAWGELYDDIHGEIEKGFPSDWRSTTGDSTAQRQAHFEKWREDRKSTRLNSSHRCISYAVFCLKKKKDMSGDLTRPIDRNTLPVMCRGVTPVPVAKNGSTSFFFFIVARPPPPNHFSPTRASPD